jgi:hypothetical protein
LPSPYAGKVRFHFNVTSPPPKLSILRNSKILQVQSRK